MSLSVTTAVCAHGVSMYIFVCVFVWSGLCARALARASACVCVRECARSRACAYAYARIFVLFGRVLVGMCVVVGGWVRGCVYFGRVLVGIFVGVDVWVCVYMDVYTQALVKVTVTRQAGLKSNKKKTLKNLRGCGRGSLCRGRGREGIEHAREKMFIWRYVYTFVYMYIHIYMYIHEYICTRCRNLGKEHAHVFVLYLYFCTHFYVSMYINICVYIYVYIYTYMYIYIYIYTSIYIYVYIYMYIYTYMYIFIYVCKQCV